MRSRKPTWGRVTIHGNADERRAAFDRLLAQNKNSLFFSFIENGDGTTTCTTNRNGEAAEIEIRPSAHLRQETKPGPVPGFVNLVLGEA